MLSFCARPKGRVAESIIQRITLTLRERGPSQTVGEGLGRALSPPLIRPDGHLLPREKILTSPQIFCDGENIGGFTDLVQCDPKDLQ